MKASSGHRFPGGLIERLPLFLVSIDPQGRFGYLSPWLREMTGLDNGETDPYPKAGEVTGLRELLPDILADTGIIVSTVSFRNGTTGKVRWKNLGRIEGWYWLAAEHSFPNPEEYEKEEKDFFRIAFEASLSGVAIVDKEGNVILANRTAKEIYGLPPDKDIQGLSIFDLIPPRSTERIDFAKRLREEGNVVNKVHEMQRPDGKVIQVQASTAVVYDDKGEPAFLVTTFRDITDELQRKKELEEALRRAEESDRLKTAFLTNVSHEIRTPLNAIVGFSRLLADPRVPEKNKKEFIRYIEQSSESLLRLINDILDISKIESGQIVINREKFSLKDFFRELEAVAREEQVRYEKIHLKLYFRQENCKDDPWMEGDPHRLKQVLSNLIGNALKFTEKGCVEVRCFLSGDKVRFVVEDSGPGIPEEEQETIFERFRQVDNSFTRKYGGAGLGLAITRSLVEHMGGDLILESRPGKGARFTVSFSGVFWKEKISQGRNKQEGALHRPDWHGRTILVAEDEPSNFDLLKALLEPTGVVLLHAWNGREALPLASSRHPDLLLMDLRMPEMDGITALREIRKTLPTVPAIALTAFAMADERKRCLAAGFDDYLAKPVNVSLLFEKVGQLLEKKEKGADL